jgi:GTP cyclohydrolase FolE2
MLMEEREVQEAKDKIPIPVTVVGIKTLVMVEH